MDDDLGGQVDLGKVNSLLEAQRKGNSEGRKKEKSFGWSEAAYMRWLVPIHAHIREYSPQLTGIGTCEVIADSLRTTSSMKHPLSISSWFFKGSTGDSGSGVTASQLTAFDSSNTPNDIRVSPSASSSHSFMAFSILG